MTRIIRKMKIKLNIFARAVRPVKRWIGWPFVLKFMLKHINSHRIMFDFTGQPYGL